MRLRRFHEMLVLLLVLMPPGASALCSKDEPGWLWNYDGTIGDGHRVRMTLVLRGERVDGLYFYASQLRDIPLKGRIANGTEIVLDELDTKGNVTARFEGSFAGHDPRGQPSDSKPECESIVGVWRKLDSQKQLPVRLSMESGTAGTLANRYTPAGADDDRLIHRNAQGFRDAVKRADKKAVAALIAYPIRVQVNGGAKRLRGPADLVAHYDAIFSPVYRAAIANALPRNMFVRDQGIMLGNGEAWFGPDGKVIALNNR